MSYVQCDAGRGEHARERQANDGDGNLRADPAEAGE
jgi:hypothetical protein